MYTLPRICYIGLLLKFEEMDGFYDIDRIVERIISGGDGVTYEEALALLRKVSYASVILSDSEESATRVVRM